MMMMMITGGHFNRENVDRAGRLRPSALWKDNGSRRLANCCLCLRKI